ncbi:MAG TPA: methyltransferase domain-containing protein [Candidatus Enterenecus stercoripullorum]|nr:methyltransferase domain-containing protein [Candidatus Enterenecus stercoripullorum]
MEAYTTLARYYDQLTGDVHYGKWADYLQRHFHRHKGEIRSVAELACGTGSLAKLLAQRGYQVTAVDRSADMLCQADQKCQGLDVLFLCQDLSQLRLLQPVDAAVCCLDSLNYITRPAQLRQALRRVHQALKPGGLFLFDVKTPEALEGADGQIYLDETNEVYCVWRGEYFPRLRICGYGIDLFVRQSDGTWQRTGEYHQEYAYTMQELESWLEEAGFTRIKQYGNLRMTPPRRGEERVFFTAERKGL